MAHPKRTDQQALSHLKQQEALLSLEYEYEKKEYEELCRQVGIPRRIRQGKCRYPLGVGRSFYNALDQMVVEVESVEEAPQATEGDTAPANTVPEHEFEPGRPVSFFHTAQPDEAGGRVPRFLPYTCQVSRVEGNRMQITVPNMQAVEVLRDYANRGMLGVQTAFDATSFRVMREAIHHVAESEDARLSRLRSVLIGTTAPEFRVEQPVRFPWLNESQEAAIQKVLTAREVAIVHGPPGTGKTTTLVEAIGETLRREAQVLVCAQSNAAVDWICEQLLGRGVSVLRVGNPMRVSDALLSATYERRYENHPDYTELWSIRRELRRLYGTSARHLSATERHRRESQINKLRGRATELEIRIDEALFASTRVVACTLIGSASKVLERKHFPTLFIDEAAQAFEAACWAAIQKADRVIFAGDHKQLPPTIKSREAERAGLGRTLMEHVATAKPECVELLTVQYRMHRDIMAFSSQRFYGGRLKAAPEIADRTVLPMEFPLVWVDTAALGFEEEQNDLSQSRLNRAEADLLVQTLCGYVERVGIERLRTERTDFGIISPYKSQVQLLRQKIKSCPALTGLRSQISVNTVDGFQGQERDVIMISMVRGNDEGRIGFLNDLRRMNVAITRARMKLFILGDSITLSHTSFYKQLFEHVQRHGQVVTPHNEEGAL
jgi:superfamily I DNA and/or RNA helicase